MMYPQADIFVRIFGYFYRSITTEAFPVKNPATVVVRSEFRKGTAKVFSNSEEKAIKKQLTDRNLIIESGRAAFFDVRGIEAIEIRAA